MIYLRPSRRIKNTESAGNIVISESLLDEHLSHIAYFAGDKRPFVLRIEASNGVVLDEHSTTATELSVRIYTREGVDVTEFTGSLKPSWQIGAEAVGQGLSYTVQASSLKSWHTKIVVTTSAARILDAMGKLQSKTAEEQRLLERLTIDASIEVRRDFVLLQRIPTAELIRDSLKADATFVAATKGDKGERGLQGVQGKPGAAGAPGKDGKSVTAQEVVSALNTDSFRGSIRDSLKADATFVAATKGDKGEQGVQGVQGKPGAKGEPGKSVTAQEVVSALNTNSFRESVSQLIDLNKLAASAASKVVGTSTLLARCARAWLPTPTCRASRPKWMGIKLIGIL